MSHRNRLAADFARARLGQQWSLLFRDWDVVLYPPASCATFPHDHSLPIEARHIEIDGKAYPFYAGNRRPSPGDNNRHTPWLSQRQRAENRSIALFAALKPSVAILLY